MEDGESGRQTPNEKGQERAAEGVSDSGQPAAGNLSRPSRDNRMAGWEVGLAPSLKPKTSTHSG